MRSPVPLVALALAALGLALAPAAASTQVWTCQLSAPPWLQATCPDAGQPAMPGDVVLFINDLGVVTRVVLCPVPSYPASCANTSPLVQTLQPSGVAEWEVPGHGQWVLYYAFQGQYLVYGVFVS